MNDTPNDDKKPRRPWTTWLLIASLAANLLVVGVLVGHALRGDDDRKPRAHPRDPLRIVVAALPEGERQEVIAAGRSARQATRAEFRRLREDLIAALEADPYDPAVVAGLFAAQADIVRNATNAALTPLATKVGALPLENRQALAEKLRNIGRDHRR